MCIPKNLEQKESKLAFSSVSAKPSPGSFPPSKTITAAEVHAMATEHNYGSKLICVAR